MTSACTFFLRGLVTMMDVAAEIAAKNPDGIVVCSREFCADIAEQARALLAAESPPCPS